MESFINDVIQMGPKINPLPIWYARMASQKMSTPLPPTCLISFLNITFLLIGLK